ncbi:MAG: phospholipid carrier-dependent glycosyltransferase [Pseudolabrys sp.]
MLVRLLTLSGYPILDRTEARYAYIGELMVQTGNWITPFFDHNVPLWAKPILSFWLTAASFSVFGINAFAARLPAFLIFISVCWITFALGRGERDKEFGLAAATIFASTSLAFYLGGTVMTDPALMLGIALTMTGFWKAVGQQQLGMEILVLRWRIDRHTRERSSRNSSSWAIYRFVDYAAPQMERYLAPATMANWNRPNTSTCHPLVRAC